MHDKRHDPGNGDLKREYGNMYATYSRIFTRLGLKFRAVAADTGSIGGTGSHEFHVLADSGEDDIAFCPDSDYAANIELAEALARAVPRSQHLAKVEIAGPGFINFHLNQACRLGTLRHVFEQGERYGYAPAESREPVQVEFV